MKKIIIILLVVSAILSSCNDFLDVDPRNQVKKEILFETQDGFKMALNGVYISMAGRELYGKNTTMELPELLCRSWALPTDITELNYYLSTHDYKQSKVDDYLDYIWRNYYNCIYQLNDIEDALSSSKIEFSHNNKNLIHGELLGLRAFLHFDILRFWGPSPNHVSDADIAIPYVSITTKDPNALLSKPYGEVVKLIEKDLNKAEELLKDIDPVLKFTLKELNTIRETTDIKDKWHYYRQNRFNYYAVLATKARLYHWIGDKTKAIEYAKKVVDAVNLNGTVKFRLADELEYTVDGANLIMFDENIFSVHTSDQQTIIQSLFKSEAPKLTQTIKNLDVAYEASVNNNDIRYQKDRSWSEIIVGTVKMGRFNKYIGTNNILSRNMVPLIRLTEMYFILIENSPLSEAQTYFSQYRIARNMSPTLDNTLSDENQVLLRLEKEYRKDFFGEGQMFFFYKKHDYETFTWPTVYPLASGLSTYVLPKPKSQSKFE